MTHSHGRGKAAKSHSCRICRESGGFMMTPCACKGTMKFIHQTCLRKWIRATSKDYRIRCPICREMIQSGGNGWFMADGLVDCRPLLLFLSEFFAALLNYFLFLLPIYAFEELSIRRAGFSLLLPQWLTPVAAHCGTSSAMIKLQFAGSFCIPFTIFALYLDKNYRGLGVPATLSLISVLCLQAYWFVTTILVFHLPDSFTVVLLLTIATGISGLLYNRCDLLGLAHTFNGFSTRLIGFVDDRLFIVSVERWEHDDIKI